MEHQTQQLVNNHQKPRLTKAIAFMLVLPFTIMINCPTLIVPFGIIWILIGTGLNTLGVKSWFIETGFLITYGFCCAIIGYYAFIWPLHHDYPNHR